MASQHETIKQNEIPVNLFEDTNPRALKDLLTQSQAPFDLTWSCYSASDRACGVCDSCVLRLRGFAQAGAQDPIPYEAATAAGIAGSHS